MTPITAVITNAFWYDVYATVRVIFIVFEVLFFGGFVFALVKALEYRPKYYLRPPKEVKRALTLQDAVLRDRWTNAEKRFALGTPEALKAAIVEADAVADAVLKELGLPGEHMADRLERLSEEEVRTLGRVWRAHRVRNNVVHSPDFELTPDEASRTFGDYRAFLKELDVIA
jgi:hypothetical protein